MKHYRKSRKNAPTEKVDSPVTLTDLDTTKSVTGKRENRRTKGLDKGKSQKNDEFSRNDFSAKKSVTEKRENRRIQGLDKGENQKNDEFSRNDFSATSVTVNDEIVSLLREIKNLLERGSINYQAPISRNIDSSPIDLGNILEGLEVRKAKSDQVPWMNLTISTAGITGDWDVVVANDELWEYGIKHNKIPTRIIESREELRIKIRERYNKNKIKPKIAIEENSETPLRGGPKAMDVPQFEAPVFDDEDLLGMLRKK